MTMLATIQKATLAALMTATASVALAADLPKRVFCVFDPIGTRGPVYEGMLDYQTTALEWGVQLELKAYTNEAVVLADFKAGKCDSMGLTGTRVRPFNRFTGSIEALGGLNDYKQLEQLIGMLSSPKASKYMVQDNYEIAGIMPGGAVYVFVRDRAINSVETAAGKRIATLDYDAASRVMVEHVGATMVPSSVATFAPRFNNGDVDIAYAPAIAYEPFEMYKGLGKKGAIYKFSLAQMNFQMVTYKDRFPKGFAQKSRQYAFKNFKEALKHIATAEAGIPANHWLGFSADREDQYKEMLRQVRMSLTKDGVYDKRMMKLMFKLRCRSNPAHPECTERLEG